MIAVVHHPAYVAPAPARSTYRWNKNGLIRDLLREAGDRVMWHEPEAMPRRWLEVAFGLFLLTASLRFLASLIW